LEEEKGEPKGEGVIGENPLRKREQKREGE